MLKTCTSWSIWTLSETSGNSQKIEIKLLTIVFDYPVAIYVADTTYGHSKHISNDWEAVHLYLCSFLLIIQNQPNQARFCVDNLKKA